MGKKFETILDKAKVAAAKAKEKAEERYLLDYIEVDKAAERLLTLKLSIGGLIAGTLAAMLSSTTYSSQIKLDIILLLFCVILLLAQEFWMGISSRKNALAFSRKIDVLASIIVHGVSSENIPAEQLKIVSEAIKIHNNEAEIPKNIEMGIPAQKIVEKHTQINDWKLNFLIWVAVAMCVPVLFLFEIFLK